MTLYDTFMNSTQPISVPWRIFERTTRKKICDNYGRLKADDESIDDLQVYKAEVKYNKKGIKYVRVTVETA